MNHLFNYIAITNNPSHAIILDRVGVQQIMVDAEIIGKEERQKGKNTIISDHLISDVKKLKDLHLSSKIVCRINGYHSGTSNEIDEAIDSGADIIMIPMIRSMKEFEEMVKQINNKCKVLPLIETPYSFFKLPEIAFRLRKPAGCRTFCL